MTKESYLDMCDQMNTSPIDTEVPIDLEDMPLEIEEAYHVYSLLPDKIDSFNGIYYGKALEHCPSILDFLGTESKKDILKLILIIDSIEREEINRKKNNGR